MGEQGFNKSSNTGHATRSGRAYQNISAQHMAHALRQVSNLPTGITSVYSTSFEVRPSQSPQEEWDNANEDLFSIVLMTAAGAARYIIPEFEGTWFKQRDGNGGRNP